MKNKKIHILCDDKHDYVANVNDEVIELNYSLEDSWSSHIKGTKIGNLEDNGNEIMIKFNDLDLKLDYSTFSELYLLCSLKVKEDKNLMGKIKYLEEK